MDLFVRSMKRLQILGNQLLLLCLESNPNIEGSVTPGAGGGARFIGMGDASGVFTTGNKVTGGGGYTVNAGKSTIVFTASNGNSLYSGDKLQASALQCLACIKT